MSELANGLGLCEADGAALHYTPHDFRRIFITDIVNVGFPIHLAAKIVGHNNIEVTRACTAVYQKDVFDAYERFIENRRLARPSAEYHEPPKPSGMSSSSTSASARSRSVTATAHMDQTVLMSTRASAATSARLIRLSLAGSTRSVTICGFKLRKRNVTGGSATWHSYGSPSSMRIGRRKN